VKKNFAAEFAYRLRTGFDLTYRTQVNLEASIGQMIDCGMKPKDVTEVLLDIFDNLAFVNKVPVIIPGKGLRTVQIVVPEENLPKKKGVR
jgi:hypothetical protein